MFSTKYRRRRETLKTLELWESVVVDTAPQSLRLEYYFIIYAWLSIETKVLKEQKGNKYRTLRIYL